MKRIPLKKYVQEKGQAKVAEELGVHQTAISKAVRTNRKIMVTIFNDGKVSAMEIRPFPHLSQS